MYRSGAGSRAGLVADRGLFAVVINFREPGEFGDGATMATSAEVSNERLSLIASGIVTRLYAGASGAPQLDRDIADALTELLQSRASVVSPDSVTDLFLASWAEADKAMRKFPQPNYVISKVAEEAGEVVKAAIHCAEGRDTHEHVIEEITQAMAMLIRLFVEGDQVHGLPPLTAALSVSHETGNGGTLPKLANCGRYLAEDNTGQWHYLNHAGAWQGCPMPLPAPTDETQGVKREPVGYTTQAMLDALQEPDTICGTIWPKAAKLATVPLFSLSQLEAVERELSDWKNGRTKSVRAHAAALTRAETAEASLAAMTTERNAMREALEEMVDSLAPAEHASGRDPAYGDRVRALGAEIGFGALMSCASTEWRLWLEKNGYPVGSEFVSGPCRSVLQSDLRRARAALAAGGNGQ